MTAARRPALPRAPIVWVALTIGCAAPRLAPGGSEPGAPAHANESLNQSPADALLRLVPDTAEVLLLVDLVQLRGSAWTREVLGATQGKDAPARAAAKGFDEITDVDQMVIAAVPSVAADSTQPGTALTIMRGRFDAGRVLAAARSRWPGADSAPFRGRVVVSHEGEAVALVAADVYVSGPLAVVRSAIDCLSGKAPDVRRAEWLQDVRQALTEGQGRRRGPPALELALTVTPDIRERMKQELGDGGDLRLCGARVALDTAADVALVGVTRTRQQAADMAARLSDQVRTLRGRRSVAALGLDVVLERLRFAASGARLVGALSVSEDQRDLVGEKMRAVAALLADPPAAGAGVATTPELK